MGFRPLPPLGREVVFLMLEAAGGTPSKDLDAKSFLGVIKGDTETHRDATFALNTGDKDMNRSPARAVRTAKYKYILNLLPQDIFKTHITDAGGEDGLFYWRSWEKLAAGGDVHAKEAIDRYRHRPAEELYDVEADPYELEALTALGRSLLEDGRTVQALEAFARVLRFDPEHTGALYHQGTGFARQQQFDQAVQVWERVIQLAPNGPFAAEARSRARSARDLQNIFAAAG